MAIFLEQIRVQNANTGDILRVEGNQIVPMDTTETEQASLVAGDNITLEANGLISASFSVTTSDVIEKDVLYYTDERVYANVAKLALSTFRDDVGYATRFDLDRALTRLNTTDVPEGENLYYTEQRVKDFIHKHSKLYTDEKVGEYISANVTSDDIAEGSDNLYFTNERAVQAIKAGDKISISADGVISAEAGGSGSFNSDIDGSIGYGLTNSMEVAIAFEHNAIIHSIHLTNTSDSKASTASASVMFFMGPKKSEYLLDDVHIPYGGSVETLCKPQVAKRGDRIRMQGFLDGIPTGGAVHATIVYESVGEEYDRTAKTVSWNEETVIYTSTGKSSIVESIKAVNVDQNQKDHGLKVLWKSPEGNIKGYICNNFVVPARSTIEFCEKPHRLAPGDTITAVATHSDAVALFVSAIRK